MMQKMDTLQIIPLIVSALRHFIAYKVAAVFDKPLFFLPKNKSCISWTCV